MLLLVNALNLSYTAQCGFAMVYWDTCSHTTQQQHPFNNPLSGTTQVSWYQKGKTNLDLLEQETMSGGCITGPYRMHICTSPMPAPYHYASVSICYGSSVCASVCVSHACFVSKQLHWSSWYFACSFRWN